MFTLKVNQYAQLSAAQIDVDGNPLETPVPGYSLSFVSSDPTIGAISPIGQIVGTGLVGTVTVTSTETKDGAPTLTGSDTFNFTGPVPTGLRISMGAPINK